MDDMTLTQGTENPGELWETGAGDGQGADVAAPEDETRARDYEDGEEETEDEPEAGAETDDGDTNDGDADETGDEDGQTAQKRGAQGREENSAAREARIRASAETEARIRGEYDAAIAGLGITNPYTGQPFQGLADFRDYGKRYQEAQLERRAKKEGRPVEELREEEENRAFIRQKRQEEKIRAAGEENARKMREFLVTDVRRFKEAYPDVDPVKLEKNERFVKFAKGRLYREPLAEIYGDYMDFASETERTALEKARGKEARGTGAGTGRGATPALTAAQQRGLNEWNSNYPHLKMTAAEYLKRDS